MTTEQFVENIFVQVKEHAAMKAANVTSGNFAAFDADGNLMDSGKNPGDITVMDTLIGKFKADIASVEEGDAASKSYAEGDLIVWKGTLVKVTSAIASGATLALGTNVVGTTVEAEIANGGGGGELTADLPVTETVGGVTSGTTYLQGTPLEDIFKDMLNPVKYPSFTSPSASMTATGAKLWEVGGTLATTMTITFSRGAIAPAYGTSGFRSGEATGYSLNGGTAQSGNTFSVTVSEAQKTYQGTVNYAAGEQPKDSTGADYSTPLPAGSVNSNTITYEFVNALWANTASIGTVAKLSLVSKSAKQRVLSFPAAPASTPETFDIPSSWTVTGILVKNELSGNYEDCSSEFTSSTVTHQDAGGNTVNYTRYVDNRGYSSGAREIKVQWV